jgi:uncharacterized protein (TIGR02611 family)
MQRTLPDASDIACAQLIPSPHTYRAGMSRIESPTAHPAPARQDGVLRRAEVVRARIRALPGGRTTWRVAVTVLGMAIILTGILLLPLPGPGWLIIFAGLGLLGTEYEWAHRLLGWVRRQVQGWWHWLARQPLWVRALVVIATALFVVVVVAVVLWWYF